MPDPALDPEDIRASKYIITHVFNPLQLPDSDDHSIDNDHSLATAVATAARLYNDHISHLGPSSVSQAQWNNISRMLENLRDMTRSESLDGFLAISQFRSMNAGDILVLPIRSQNAVVVFRRQKDVTIFESFELFLNAKHVMSTEGKVICSYPGPAIEIPNAVLSDKIFLSELSNFLVRMDCDDFDATLRLSAFRDTVHPRYITELLTGILRSLGRPADVSRICKRVGDEVMCNDDPKVPWRRSALWLLIRVVLQTTLDRSPLGRDAYKEFILFFMCYLADEGTSTILPNDLLHVMSAKISRRLWKLGPSAPDWLSFTVLQTCTSLRSLTERRWTQVQADRNFSPLWAPSELNLAQDRRLSLLHSKDYLFYCIANRSVVPPSIPFSPHHRHRGALDDFLSSDGTFFDLAYGAERYVTLYDVEQAVEEGIDGWVDRVKDNNEACVKLEILAEKYSSKASEAYAGNPELLSVMLLTMIELWIALDKITIREIPMLADYSPEIPASLLENLLLCKAAGLQRLCHAQEYLSGRHSQCQSQQSVFSSTITAESFAIRFYRGSSHLQDLKARIEEVARREVREKAAELWRKNARCAMHLFCTHDSIMAHVWPLPSDPLQAEAVVFELDCPIPFNMWRTATFHFLVDICSPSFSVRRRDAPQIKLNSYRPIQPYLVKYPRSRISIGSNSWPLTKPDRIVSIPARLKRVCVKNKLDFFAFDTHTGFSVSEALGRSDGRKHCTYKLPSGPYHNLQKYVGSTFHTSNEIIADQASCHKDLSIHEYMAFGHLRSGSLLQWLNILRELRGRSLSFRRPEVHMLLAQAISQVGPLGSMGWTWHQEIQEPTFCHALLGELRSLIRDVEANWMEAVTMDTVSLILRRLLASSPDEAISKDAIALLCTVRSMVFSWVRELSTKVVNTSGDGGLRDILRDTAAICRGTFNVGPAMISKVLRSADDVDALLSSAIIIHDLIPSNFSSLSAYSQLLLDRDRHLSLVLESAICDVIRADSHDVGVNLAVGRIWPEYRPGSKWAALPTPNSRWFQCETAPQGDQCPEVVHFNILDGSLLVNGRPFGIQLPIEFVRRPLYKQIFGERVLTVMQGGLPGVDYLTRDLIHNHQVYLSLRDNGSTLVIQAKFKGEASDQGIIELIPHERLEGDLPATLIEGHAHWLNLSTSVMEIRPLDTLWETSSGNWKINCSRGDYHMQKGNEYLVDIRSKSWEMVSGLLQPLSPAQDLIISVSQTESADFATSSLQLSVVLPRYDLSFYVDEDGDLQSRNFRGMVYDENQSVGTFFGLVNQLVLRPKNNDIFELIPRCVLVPDGDISFRTDGHHVRVEVTPDCLVAQRIAYQTYTVNTDLGCLTGNGSLTSKLYCAYLHALTSGICPDPLTGKSGTEEALTILRSASCWSNMKFSSRDAHLLGLIASLCPVRTWYRKELMQRVEWLDLPASSQNHELYFICKAIKEHHESVVLSRGGPANPLFKAFPSRDDQVLKCAVRRASYLFPSEFSKLLSETNSDVRYPARDLVDASGEHRAYIAAFHVYHRIGKSTTDIWQMVKSWEDMPGLSRRAPLSLQYDGSWLAPDLPSIWLKTYNLVRKNDEGKWFRMLFSLPAMAYTSSNLSDLVPLFVAFASHQQFSVEDPPQFDSCAIKKGCNYSNTRWAAEYHCVCAFCQLEQHLTRVRKLLRDLCSGSSRFPIHEARPYTFQPSHTIRSHTTAWPFTLRELFARPAPVLPTHDRLYHDVSDVGRINTPPSDTKALHQLIAKVMEDAVNPFQHQYASALHSSAEFFGSEVPFTAVESTKLPTTEALIEHYARCKINYIGALRRLQRNLGPRSRSEQVVEQSGQWPHITAHLLFRSLASNSPTKLREDWKKFLVAFTLLALELQRARRLLLLHKDSLHEELRGEILNEGCDGWDAEAHPDWLLIQLQGNFFIRRVQAEVANEMISPRSGGNTAMQLNMGEGKSFVIVPIVAAALANGRQLVRIIVPKPLTPQTLHLLTDRLSGLTNRRIYYLPFSRSSAPNDKNVASLRQVLLECMQERGILVMQPDHVLSLKLASVEKQLSREVDHPVADQLLELQRWLHSHSRDILDESDEILDVRSQLVFSIGDQQHIEGSPERWTTTEQVLGLVSKHASSLRNLFPLGVEYKPGPPGSFPYLRIMQADAAQKLIAWIVEDVMEGALPNISFGQLHLHPGLGDEVRTFISCKNIPTITSDGVMMVKKCYGRTLLWSDLLLLRGLLANGILLFAFTDRRWRVDYGLSPTRTMLAVPYRAKDVPAQKAEFGHPDVAIILTCLSYYYGGLSEEQLRLSFSILFKQHDASSTFDLWVRACSDVPEFMCTVSGVNVQSTEQWNNTLFPLFSRNRETVNFYLTNVVFPREAKEFPSKLSSSGWDLAEKKEHVLTGFSGTNDGQYLLPLHIAQRDPDHQRGTNAKVLSHLLQPENNHYICTSHENGDRRNSRDFLRILVAQEPEIRVLLDVGAQMLDLQNHEVADAWLDIAPNVSAAIYFNEDDELMVRARDGNAQFLWSSPFAQQLDRCVAYLDDAHTRGTDIRFPAGFRAAVTLGSKITKDRLVQGCMRMRKLGHGHSVMFFAPLETDRRIRSLTGKDKDPADIIETMDILQWTIRETWDSIQRWAPHWVQQGMDHESRYAAWSRFCRGQLTSKQLSDKWLQAEAKRLEDLYEPCKPSDLSVLTSTDIRQRCIDLGVVSLSSVGMDEEQERELIYEVRRERKVVARPPLKVLPATHSIHQDVIDFVRTGVISTHSIFFKTPNRAFSPAFDSLSTTSAATDESFIWSQSVLVTKDFQQTIQGSVGCMDDYLRPVHWVLSAKKEFGDLLVISSPYEVNCLLPDIRSSDKVHLHLYAARVTKSVKPCDDLALYSTPSVPKGWLLPSSFSDQLGMFAGQLYLKDYQTYLRLCRFLCVYTRELRGEEGIVVEPDGFIQPINRSIRIAHTFSSSPLVSLRALMELRNKGVDFTSTHMGRLLHGQLLCEGDFDD